MKPLSFDEVFRIWINNEVGQVEGRDILPVAKQKGFTSIAEWRLQTALRLGMDKLTWRLEVIVDPGRALPQVIIGPYQGWSKFFDNRLETTFAQAMDIPKFFRWCQTHNRVVPLSERFPLPTDVILFRKLDGNLIAIEGGHRVCAVAYAQKIGRPIDFADRPPVSAAIADIDQQHISTMLEFLEKGTYKQ